MPISNYIPSSRLIAPGVCTSLTRPASPFEGQAIFETDTDRMLIWNGSTWVVPNAPAQNPTGLELIKTQSVTSGTSMQMSSVFSSTYDSYRAVINDFQTTGSASGLTMSFGDPNQVSSGYFWAAVYLSGYGASPTVTAHGGNNVSSLETNIVASGSQSAGAVIDIFNPNKALYTGYVACGPDMRSNGNPRQPATGYHNGTNQFTSLYFACGTTLSMLTVSVYGYRK